MGVVLQCYLLFPYGIYLTFEWISYYELIFFIFLIMAQKLVLIPGATIRDNTVLVVEIHLSGYEEKSQGYVQFGNKTDSLI